MTAVYLPEAWLNQAVSSSSPALVSPISKESNNQMIAIRYLDLSDSDDSSYSPDFYLLRDGVILTPTVTCKSENLR